MKKLTYTQEQALRDLEQRASVGFTWSDTFDLPSHPSRPTLGALVKCGFVATSSVREAHWFETYYQITAAGAAYRAGA